MAAVETLAAPRQEPSDLLGFWQWVAAAELPTEKAWILWDAYLKEDRSLSQLREHPAISGLERSRLKPVSLNLDQAKANGIFVVPHADFPETLARVKLKLPALFAMGDWEAVKRPTIGIVGTRAASAYGRAVAFKFAEAFARAGLTVVSGGALGIDAEAHKGAMSGGGKTVAVLAGGVDVTYPRVHAGLFANIRDHGCLVSQFAIGTKPWQSQFLVRNRLIAALSQAVLVIEAPQRSGALSTATAANELSRDVYVVPANIDNEHFRGSHGLIRDGAILVDHPDQVLEGLNIAPAVETKQAIPVSEAGQTILAALTTEPLSAERISERTGIEASTALAELTVLELDGLVTRAASGYAVRL